MERLRLRMLEEGHRLIDAARSEGIDLRLLGGLGVREHCHTLEVCARDYSDLDMVALAKQAHRLARLFATFGYVENHDVSTATENAELQFVRSCQHSQGSGEQRADLDFTFEQLSACLGGSCVDVHLNERAYWRCVPTRVWSYTIGGYQVMKKWLSYRERAVLDRDLTPDEARYVMEMARRIAATLLLEPDLVANYERVKAETYSRSGVRSDA